MEIEEKYIKLIGKGVYSPVLKKYGRISSLEIAGYIGGLYHYYNVYYDSFDDRHFLNFDALEKGEVKFVFYDYGNDALEEAQNIQIEEVKSALGDSFKEDMIIWMSAEDNTRNVIESEARNIQRLHTDLVSLTELSAEIFEKNFYCRELYLKYKYKILTETEFLYAVTNYLSAEMKRVEDRNAEYFFKYEFGKQIEQFLEGYDGIL